MAIRLMWILAAAQWSVGVMVMAGVAGGIDPSPLVQSVAWGVGAVGAAWGAWDLGLRWWHPADRLLWRTICAQVPLARWRRLCYLQTHMAFGEEYFHWVGVRGWHLYHVDRAEGIMMVALPLLSVPSFGNQEAWRMVLQQEALWEREGRIRGCPLRWALEQWAESEGSSTPTERVATTVARNLLEEVRPSLPVSGVLRENPSGWPH